MRFTGTTKQAATAFNRAVTAAGTPGRDPQIDALRPDDIAMLQEICGYELARPPSAGLVPVPAAHLGRMRQLQARGELPRDAGAAMIALNDLVEQSDGYRPLSEDLIANMLSWMRGRGVDIGMAGRALLSRHTHLNRYA